MKRKDKLLFHVVIVNLFIEMVDCHIMSEKNMWQMYDQLADLSFLRLFSPNAIYK